MAEPTTKTFAMRHGVLVRTVVPRRGEPYVQRCDLETFTAVAYLIDERAGRGLTTQEMWDGLPDAPCTQVSVALDFLKERGCVAVECRRCYPASNFFYEDALTEWHALAHHQTTET